jgi:glycerol-3-phosphate dehydrogenase (NAD(P)+)
MKDAKVAVIGAGMFGYPIADYIAKIHGKQVSLLDIDKGLIEHLKTKKSHPTHFKDLVLSDLIIPTDNAYEALKDRDLIVLALPSSKTRQALSEFKQHIKKGSIILNLSKGLEPGTDKRISQIINEELPDLNCEIASLSGGMIASEFVHEQPLFATIASENIQIARKLASYLSSHKLHLDTSSDIIGTELAGPLKNIIAISAGILVGKGYTPSSIAGFITRASKEAMTIATKLGSKKHTFSTSSSAWAGDLIATCFGESRNREFGMRLGKGEPVSLALEEMKKENKLVEGYNTIKAVHEIVFKNNLNCPIMEKLYSILYEGKSPETLVEKYQSY